MTSFTKKLSAVFIPNFSKKETDRNVTALNFYRVQRSLKMFVFNIAKNIKNTCLYFIRGFDEHKSLTFIMKGI
eukprot:UN01495